jgi:hypothetical protein
VYAIAHALQEMKSQTCPNDTIETSWISRHSGLPDTCAQMRHIDGEQFYKKYLLNVKFKGNLFFEVSSTNLFRYCQHKFSFHT